MVWQSNSGFNIRPGMSPPICALSFPSHSMFQNSFWVIWHDLARLQECPFLPGFCHIPIQQFVSGERFHFGPPRNHFSQQYVYLFFGQLAILRRQNIDSIRRGWKHSTVRPWKVCWLNFLRGITASEAAQTLLCRGMLTERGCKSLGAAMLDQVAGWYWFRYSTKDIQAKSFGSIQ